MRCPVKWPKLSCAAPSEKMKALIGVGIFVIIVIICSGVVLAKPFGSSPRHYHYQRKDKELVLIHVVSRHGERTPADTYPNDIYVNNTFYPFGWGQITTLGRKNQFASGQFLRQRYDSFLGDLYTPSIVFAQSTAADRAFMSCSLILAGLWPPKNTPLDWGNLNWSPIPIRSEPLDEDTLLLVRKRCPRYNEELNKVFKRPEVRTLLNNNANLFKQLTNITGLSITTPDDVQSLYSTLLAEATFGLKLPPWTKQYYPGKLIPLTAQSFILNVYNDLMKRLKGGPLLKKLISDWSSKAAGKLNPNDRKMFVYTGHDSTVANLLHTLGVWEAQVPAYGIMSIFELYEDTATKEFGVEIYLRNSTTSEPYQLLIPGCKHHCPLTELIKLMKNVIPGNWTEECIPEDSNFVPPTPGGP